MEKIVFKKIDCGKYKYELLKQYSIMTNIRRNNIAISKYLTLDVCGKLTIKKGYQWDGCSGPTLDDDTNMRAGLVHDAIYQLMYESLISDGWRRYADKLFYQILREDGMPIWRAKYYYIGVRSAGWLYV